MLFVEELLKEEKIVPIFKCLSYYWFWDKDNVTVAPKQIGLADYTDSLTEIAVRIPGDSVPGHEVVFSLKKQNFGSLKKNLSRAVLRDDLGGCYA